LTPHERKLLIARLNGRNQIIAFDAAIAIWKRSDVALERPLIKMLKHGRRPFNRAAAAFALQMVTTPKTIMALEQTVSNKSEHPRVRGEAAEALAHAHRKRSHEILIRNLRDPSKDVRFWCAFSLGQMGEKRAVAALKQLAATDDGIVRGFHSVAKEAVDSLEEIRVNSGRCHFCRRP